MQKFYKSCGVKGLIQGVKTFAVLFLTTFLSVTAVANTYVPTTFTDPVFTAVNNATGAITAGAGVGLISLRSALKAADNLGGTHTITLATGTYVLDGSTTYTVPSLGVNFSGRTIYFGNTAQNITINGNGPANTIIDMAVTGRDRIMTINYDGVVPDVITTINGIKFQNGYLTKDEYGGAALYAGPLAGNLQTLAVNNCTFDNNICPTSNPIPGNGGSGGAIYMFQATLNIDNSTFTNNKSIDGSGGAVIYILYNNQGNSGAVNITNSFFSGNTAKENGGAVLVTSQGAQPGGITFTANINYNTFSGNTATGYGGGLTLNNGANLSILQAHYNRFVNNISNGPGSTSSGLHFVESDGSVNAENNWWGCNTNPVNAVSTSPCNQAGGDDPGLGSLDANPWLQLRTTASPNPICNTTAGLGNTSTVTTSFLNNSDGTAIPVANLSRLIGLPVTWGPTTLGTLSGQQGTIQASGTATATFTSDGNGGTATVNTQVDNVPPGETSPARANITVNTIPTVTNPANTAVCVGGTATFTSTVTGTPTPTIQWYDGATPLSNTPPYSGVNTATLTISNAQLGDASANYNVRATNSCGIATSADATLIVNPQPTGPTLLAKTPNVSTICTGTGVSATFTAGTGGTGCSDDYTVSIDGGAAVAYTPGNTVGAAATSSIVIQGRRASCTPGAGCIGTSYVTLASWTVAAQPAGPTLLAKTPNVATICTGTGVSATFTAGTGGAGCSDDYTVSIDGGAAVAYTPGNTVGATATTNIVIQGRRASCTTGAGCTGTTYTTLASWAVVAQPTGPTLLAKTPNVATICSGTGVSATFTAGTGGAGCGDDYTVSIDGGAAVAYTPGNTVGAAATSSIVIQGRRANCDANAGCTGTTYTTLASWAVVAQPTGPTLLAKTPNVATICSGTGVSATFTAGTGGTGCSDDYTVSIDGGAAVAYTPGNTVGATATSSIVIQGRRANCAANAGCNGTSYVTLASWSVTVCVIPNLTIDNVTQNELNSSTSIFTFTVSLSAPAGAGGVTFDIATANGTTNPATQPSDYTAKSLIGQIIPQGSSTYTFDVVVNGDLTVESNETFFVNVTNVTGANITDGQGLGTITNDDIAFDPCANIPALTCATPVTATFSGIGVWNVTACGFSTIGQERIYSFTPSLTGVYTVQVTAVSGALNIIDYFYKEASDGCDATDWICINDIPVPGLNPIGTLTAGTTYYILLDPETTGSTSHTFQINCPVDPCVNITTLTCGTPVTATPSGAGVWDITACGGNTPGQERIYSFTATVTGTHNLQVTATSGTVFRYFYKLASDGCDATDWICIVGTSSTVTTPIATLTAGTTYYILLDPLFTSAESQTFQINCPADPCVNPPVLTCGTPVSVTTSGEGAWNVTACGGDNTPGQERVYSFTPTITGIHSLQVTAATAAFGYFYKLASDGCDASDWICIATAGGVNTFPIGTLTAGVNYYILQDPRLTTASSQTFQINCPAACVAPVITAPTVTQPTCATPTGTIVVNATGSGVLEYQLNAGTFQLSNTFGSLAPGSYNITVRLQSSPTCLSTYSGNPVVLNAATGCCVAPVITTPTVAQPTCAVSTGTIVVNATGSGVLEYQLNAGTFQLSNTFGSLAPGSYNITVRLQSSPTCLSTYSGNPVVLNAATGCCVAPVINAPTVTQPTCTVSTGKIVVNATGSGTLEYQLNGGTFQLSNTFSGLAPGSYNITVRLQSSPTCLSTYSGNPVVINAATGCCAGVVVNVPTVTQPTCAISTGKIVVNASSSSTLEYRLNSGSWQTSNTFSGLAPGSYNISVRKKYQTSCVANYSGNPVVLNPATGCCVTPTINAPAVTQPTCAVSTGKIVVNATGSGTLEYKLNSGSWQTSNTFSGLAPGSYNISVRLQSNTSCVCNYSGNPVVLNAATGCCAPAINAPAITQPTCTVPTGKIVVNATGSGTLEYRLNSGSWQTSNTFGGLAPGSYNISVRLQSNTSCVCNYSGNPVVLNAATGCCSPTINAPTVTQPTCAVSTGKIVVNAAGSGTLEYRLNTGSWQTSNTFSGLAPGSYNISVRLQSNASCVCNYSGNPVVLSTATTCGPVDPNKCYKIVNRNSGKALSIEYCSTSDNKEAEQQGSSNCMTWKFVLVQTGYYKIINVNSGKSLEVKSGSSSDYTNIVQGSYSGQDYEKWSLTATGAYFVVKAKHSGKAMSVKSASTSNGADVVQKGTGSNSNEQWSFVEVSCGNTMTRGVITKDQPVISLEEKLSVTATPNPGISFFNLAFKSNNKTTPVNVRILDINGKVISARQKVNVSSTIRIAADKWAGGIYFAEVTQGGQRKVVKMIKVN